MVMKKVISNLKSFKKEGKELHLKMQFLYDKLYYSVPMKKNWKEQNGIGTNVLGRTRRVRAVPEGRQAHGVSAFALAK